MHLAMVEPVTKLPIPRRLTDGGDGAVVAKVFIGDCPRDIVTSRDGDLIYVLTADSVKVVGGLHHVIARYRPVRNRNR